MPTVDITDPDVALPLRVDTLLRGAEDGVAGGAAIGPAIGPAAHGWATTVGGAAAARTLGAVRWAAPRATIDGAPRATIDGDAYGGEP